MDQALREEVDRRVRAQLYGPDDFDVRRERAMREEFRRQERAMRAEQPLPRISRCPVHNVEWTGLGACVGCVEQAKSDREKAAGEEAKRHLEEERARRRCAFEAIQRETSPFAKTPRRPDWRNNPSFAAGSVEWSAELREKVKASSAAAAERERTLVVVDLDW